MIARTTSLAAALVVVAVGAGGQEPARRNFVACPIVQDTKTVPCWLSEYEGETYYLGIQTDISAEFHPPYLGHQVLVEGTVSSEPRVCGGIVLKPVRVSPLPEPDSSCNTILPAVNQFTVPFAPRPPGPSGGRLAFQGTTPAPAARPSPPSGPEEVTLQYDFDNGVMGRRAASWGSPHQARRSRPATRVRITGYRGATRLSDGRVMAERPEIGARRAREVADLLQEAGLTGVAFEVSSQGEPEAADGIDDWRSRRTTVHVEP